MSESSEKEDLLSIINLLAGAAQAGSKGIMAQAALNVVLASEAVVRSRNMELDQSIQDAAMSALMMLKVLYLMHQKSKVLWKKRNKTLLIIIKKLMIQL